MAATAVADARLPVTVAPDAQVTAVADFLLPAPAVAIRRQAADPRTVVADPDPRTAAAVAADMGGNAALDSFPA